MHSEKNKSIYSAVILKSDVNSIQLFRNCQIINNEADGQGSVFQNCHAPSKLTIEDCIIAGNKNNDNDKSGGAICFRDNDGYCDNGCGLEMSAYRATIREVSATLDGDIGMNYYISLPQSVAEDSNAYVQFTMNGSATKTRIPEPEADGTYKFTCWLNAKEMHDNITFSLHDENDDIINIYTNGGSEIESFEYSLAEYFEKLSSDTSEENTALVNLAKVTLAYGCYAQKAFSYDVETASSTADLSGVTAETLADHKMTKTGEIPEGLKLSEMTLILETETTLCLYFKADDINNYSFKLDEAVVTPTEISGEGLYCIKIADIAAKDLDTKHTLVINDNCTITFDAFSYAYSVVKAGENDTVCDAVKALYKYNEAANEYFNN